MTSENLSPIITAHGERIARLEQSDADAKTSLTRIETRLDTLLWWVIGTCVAAAGGLGTMLFSYATR